MKSLGKIILLVLVIIVSIYLLFFFPGQRRAPSGAPGNYYDVLDSVNDLDIYVYLVEEPDLLPDELRHTLVSSLDNVPLVYRQQKTYVVVDFDITQLTAEDFELVTSLYDTYHYRIILLNYSKNDISELNHLIDLGDDDYDFIVLEYIDDLSYSSVVISEADSNVYQRQYEIMHYILDSD